MEVLSAAEPSVGVKGGGGGAGGGLGAGFVPKKPLVNFTIDVDVIKIVLKQFENKTLSFKRKNLGDVAINVTIDTDLAKYITFEDKVISLEPKEGIIINFWSKKPGLKMDFEKRAFNFLYRKSKKKQQYTEEYEKLLFDAIIGEQTLFVNTQEVESMWRFIDPIFRAWQKNIVPLKTYQPNTDRALIESEFVGESLAQATELKKEIGIVGLGKMGKNMAARLSEKGWKVLGFDQNPHFEKLVSGLTVPRIVWLMVPAGKPVEEVIFGKNGLVNFLSKGDIIIDGGNSFYQDSLRRAALLAKKQI
ncbi:MAG: hypothetical protein IIB81_00810, partial [Nanoarchaeota archaeon]|nr:hypothetical protein [Nanoarchaeota archaeon]